MKKRNTASTVVLASALAGLPLVHPPAVQAQLPTIERPLSGPVMTKAATALKFAGRYDKQAPAQTIVGIDNGAPVYQNTRGERFTLDPLTGDMRFLAEAPVRMVKFSAIKYGGAVTILGVDAAGHVVNQNSAGQKFYLDPRSGDMVMVP